MRGRTARRQAVGKKSLREKKKDGKGFKDANQAGGDGRNGSGLGDEKCCPRIEKSRERPVGVANIYVLAARLWLHCAEFRIGKRPEERKQSSNHPGEVYEASRPHRLHHFGWNQKNSAAYDCPDDDGAGMGESEIARQFRAKMAVRCAFAHVLFLSAFSTIQAFASL